MHDAVAEDEHELVSTRAVFVRVLQGLAKERNHEDKRVVVRGGKHCE